MHLVTIPFLLLVHLNYVCAGKAGGAQCAHVVGSLDHSSWNGGLSFGRDLVLYTA